MEKQTSRHVSLDSNEYLVSIGDRRFRVALTRAGSAVVNGTRYSYDLEETSEGVISMILEGTVFDVAVLGKGCSSDRPPADWRDEPLHVTVSGTGFEALVDDQRSLLIKSLLKASSHTPKAIAVRAPMPGLIVRLEVEAGQTVNAGQGLLVLEAMKMENEIRTINAGCIDEICVQSGHTVEKDELLIRMTAQ